MSNLELDQTTKGVCTKCGKEKSLSEFYKDKGSRGYSYHCKQCIGERSKERVREVRSEVVKWTNLLYTGEELDLQLDAVSKLNSNQIWTLRAKLNKLLGEKFDSELYHKEYYQKNKERLSEKNREYAILNKEKINTYRRIYDAHNKDRNDESKRRWSDNNYLQIKLSSCKRRALEKSLPFDIELSDLEVPHICPILHIPIRISSTGRLCDNSPSVDRIIPEMGYTKGNVQMISNKANRMKTDATPLELILFAAWVLDNFDIDVYKNELEAYVEENAYVDCEYHSSGIYVE